MADNTIQRGNRPADYKANAADLTSEQLRVRRWRQYINRSRILRELNDRTEAVMAGDEYLDGKKVVKNSRSVYLNYLMPLLEEEHRNTLPSIPSCRVEPRNEAAAKVTAKIREFLDVCFSAKDFQVKSVADELQWDDDRWGEGYGKTIWRVDVERAQAPTLDVDQMALEADRAMAENGDLVNMTVSEADQDYTHVKIHQELLDTLDPMSAEAGELQAHIDEHMTRMEVIAKEHPVLERVAPDKFFFDCDVPWPKRAWEAELKSVRIQTLMDWKYKNVNPENLPAETPVGEGAPLAYQDMTAQIYEIHDRRDNKFYVISAEGPEDGLFLLQGEWQYSGVDVYVPLVFRPYKPAQAHGKSTIQACLGKLDELAKIDFYIGRHVENHANQKEFIPKGGDPATKAQLKNPDTRFVEADAAFLSQYTQQKTNPIPDTLLQRREQLLGELRREIGADAQNVAANASFQMTATEAANRQSSYNGRKADRQERMGEFLSHVAHNFLALYKTFATQKVSVRVANPEGVAYDDLNPSDIPQGVEVHLDIRGETPESKAEDAQKAIAYGNLLASLGYQIDLDVFNNWAGPRFGFMRPETLRLQAPQGQPLGMAPGMPGQTSQQMQGPQTAPAVTPAVA